MATRRAALTGAAAAILAGPAQAAAAPLRGPVDIERRRALLGHPLGRFGCPPAPDPIHDLEVQGAYTDRAFSVIDPEKQRVLLERTGPLGVYTIKVAQLSDIWLLSNPPQPQPAACALAWLDAWASADGMLGQFNTADAHHHRRWTLCGLALAYLKIRGAPGLDAAAKTRVEQWFVKLADADSAYYGKWPRAGYNNHIDWWALALMAAGVAAGDRPLFDHGVSVTRILLEDVAADGTLPLEMARKGRALGYHVFALAPLVMIAEIGAANGLDLYGAQDGAIRRLAQRVLAGLADPAWFAARADAPQEVEIGAFTFVWGEPYYARFPDPALGRQVAAHRPLFNHWLGGSTTASFGSSALPFPPHA